jgi:hypothetical protein
MALTRNVSVFFRRNVYPSIGALVLGTATSALVAAADLEVSGDFETQDSFGWKEWRSPWGAQPVYDYKLTTDPAEGTTAFYQKSTSGSFGVYQEVCVEAGKAVSPEWSWKGPTEGLGCTSSHVGC